MEDQILNILNQIEPRLYWLLAQLSGAIVLGMIANGLIQNLAAYVMFRMDKDLGKHVWVCVRGKKGRIAHFNTRWIFVSCGDRQEIINMRRWRYEKWTLIHMEPPEAEDG